MDADVYGFVEEGLEDSWICEKAREFEDDWPCGVYPHDDDDAGFPKHVNTDVVGKVGQLTSHSPIAHPNSVYRLVHARHHLP